MNLTRESLFASGATADQADGILVKIEEGTGQPADKVWLELTRTVLRNTVPYAVHRQVFDSVYENWKREQGPPPAWKPTPEEIESSNINSMCRQNGLSTYEELYSWSIRERGAFWESVVKTLGICFSKAPETILDQSDGPENARWLTGARFNIADSCFNAPPDNIAIYYQAEGGEPNQ